MRRSNQPYADGQHKSVGAASGDDQKSAVSDDHPQPVTLNPERDSIGKTHSASNDIQPVAA